MSTTEALRTQLDNLRLELQRLEVENKKLREEQGEDEATEQRKLLEQEVEELRQSLHESQEREVSSNEELVSSREERDKLQRENEQLECELAQSRARCEDVCNELKCAIEGAELERYRFVEAERAKWEARELRLVAELKAVQAPRDVSSNKAQEPLSLHSSCSSLNSPSPTQRSTVVDTLTSQSDLTVVSTCSPMDPTAAAFVPQPEGTDYSLSGFGMLATGNLLPAPTTRHGLPLERIHSSGGVAAQEITASLSSSQGMGPPGGNTLPMMSTAPHTAYTSIAGSHTYPATYVPVRPSPYSTVMSVVSLASNGSYLPAGSLLQAPSMLTPSIGATMNHSLHGIGTLATGNLLPESITRHGSSSESNGSSGGIAVQESAVSLPCGPLFAGSQLPPIGKFSGEEQDDESEGFEEWIEQFELVAEVCKWDTRARLVNLTTRLRGPAYSFYRTCPPDQRGSYEALKAQLLTRFTPVRIQAVHSNLFHQRKQSDKETVDQYAQELRKLFYKAYPRAKQASEQAEEFGRSVLAYQFTAGLLPTLRSKVAGVEGNFEQLLVKARFEEAKLRDLSGCSGDSRQFKGHYKPNLRAPSSGYRKLDDRTAHSNNNQRCFQCNGVGHYAKNCPQKNRSSPVEARGKQTQQSRSASGNNKLPSRTMLALQGTESTQQDYKSADSQQQAQDRVTKLREELRVAEVEESLAKVVNTTNVIRGDPGSVTEGDGVEKPSLGPVLMVELNLEKQTVKALIDTGSPVSIVSIEFLLQVLGANKVNSENKEDWTKVVRAKLKPPSVTIQNFSGDPVNVICQCTVEVSRGEHSCRTTVLVQKGVPQDFLVGTDLLGRLGFCVLQPSAEGRMVDLLGSGDWKLSAAVSSPVEATVSSEPDTLKKVTAATVSLLRSVRIPARHSRLAQVETTGDISKELVMFNPEFGSNNEDLQASGVLPAMCVTQVSDNNQLVLHIVNYGYQPVELEKGQVLGTLECVDPVTVDGTVNLLKSPMVVDAQVEELLSKLDIEHTLSEPQRCQLVSALTSFSDTFALDQSQLGKTDLVQHSIETGDQRPIKQLPYRTPFALRQEMEGMISQMLEQGVIQESSSPWASPVVLVAKKDGTNRFCVDYRRLNSVTKMDTFPLPRIDDSLDLLANTAYFSTLDLASGYWQVAMSAESREKTAFCSHSGHYEFNVMPFGLCNAPATFQRLMETVLAGLTRKKCVVYLDDILVMGSSFEEHLDNLTEVLQRLRQAGLRLKPTKCHLAKKSVMYLGYVVSHDGITTDPEKVKSVRNFPTPSSIKQLRSFLGLASYYRRFINGFSKVAAPLFALTRKDAMFVWNDKCHGAFVQLKELLTSAPVLVFPDFQREFVLETDASGLGLGAVLAQEQKSGHTAPIAFASRTLQKHEQAYGVTELEALGVVWAVKHFRPYLYGHTCNVYTDHEALKALLNTPHPSGKLARWGLAIQELDLRIHYRPGRANKVADALSRQLATSEDVYSEPTVRPKDGDGTVYQLTTTVDQTQVSETAERQDSDPQLVEMKKYLVKGELPLDEEKARQLVLSKPQFEIIDGVLYHLEADKSLRLLPATDDRKPLFESIHNGQFGGHLRCEKMHSQLAKYYWWPGMRSDIVKWSRACWVCASRQVGKPIRPFLSPIPVSSPFDRVGVDVIQFTTSSKGHKYAVVFVDYLTKWPEVFPARNQTSLTIAKLLVEHIVPRHGVPSQLLSDRGTAFLSKLMEEVYRLLGLKKVNTTAYHPQTDGLVERFNRTLTDMLAKKVSRSGKDWDVQLPYVLFAYRATNQQSTQESPFYLMYGRDPVLPTEAMLRPPPERFDIEVDDYVHEMTQRMSQAWEAAQVNVRKAQRRQKYHHDQKAKEPRITEGDRVFVFDPAKKVGKAYKFARPFKGPYRVIKLFPNGVELSLISKPNSPTIRVALNRVRRCPREIVDGNHDDDDDDDVTNDENDDLLDTSLLQTESVNSEPSVVSDQDNPTAVLDGASVNPPRRSERLASKQHHRDVMN